MTSKNAPANTPRTPRPTTPRPTAPAPTPGTPPALARVTISGDGAERLKQTMDGGKADPRTPEFRHWQRHEIATQPKWSGRKAK
jgi:hypothetical protein